MSSSGWTGGTPAWTGRGVAARALEGGVERGQERVDVVRVSGTASRSWCRGPAARRARAGRRRWPRAGAGSSAPGRRRRQTTTPMKSRGKPTSAKPSVSTRHDSTVAQAASIAMPATRSWWGRLLQDGPHRAAPAEAVARLCIRPSSCHAVSSRSRGPRVTERQPVEVRWRRRAEARLDGQVRAPRRRRRGRSPGSTTRGAGAGAGTAGPARRGRRRRRRRGRRGPGSASHWVSGAGEWSSWTTASASSSGTVLASRRRGSATASRGCRPRR